MYEVEIRAALPSVKELEKLASILREIGAKDLGKHRVKDTVYGLKGVYSVKETGFCFRIRQFDDKLLFDRKGQLPSAWKEEPLIFENERSAHQYFLANGLLPYLIIDRSRHEFRADDIVVSLDDVLHLGCFAELEKSVIDENLIEQAKKDLFDFLAKLGIPGNSIVNTPYGWLLTQKLEKDNDLAEALSKELGISLEQLFYHRVPNQKK